MSLRERRDGAHIGPKRTVSARQIASLLGLKDAPPPEPPIPDSPAAARLRSEGKAKEADALMEAAKEHHAERVLPAGRDVMAALGVRPEELPVGVEQELGPPPPKPHREDGWQPDGSYDGAVNAPKPDDAAAKAKLAADFRAHAKKVAALAESAKQSGDAEREAKAAAEVAASRQVGEALRARGIL